jgi:peptidoglycan/LPS O-acetylase OafA/YrhL
MIRGLAALYVAIGHAKVVFWVGGNEYISANPRSSWSIGDYLVFGLDLLSSAGQEFVIVFFVLSGFFIQYSIVKNRWKWRDFYINRCLRIYPPYIVSVLFAIGVFFFIKNFVPVIFDGSLSRSIDIRLKNANDELNFGMFLYSIFFLPNRDYIAGNFAYWSLFHEAIFYLSVPILFRNLKLMLYLTISLFIVNQIFKLPFEGLLPIFVFHFAMYFVIGMSLFNWLNKYSENIHWPRKIVSYSVILVLLLGTITLGVADFKPWSFLFAAATCIFCIAFLVKYPLRQGIIYKSLTFLGDISYTLYIMHLPFYFLIYSLLVKYSGTNTFYQRIYWLAIPFVILISYIFHILVERRTLLAIQNFKLHRRIITKPQQIESN